jgi:hypothetical protein
MEPSLKSATSETTIVGVKIIDFAIFNSSPTGREASGHATESETSSLFEREEPPMQRPRTVHWNLPISESDYNLLKIGFTPRSMDDYWEMKPVYLEESSAYSLRFLRTWTGISHYVLIIKDQGPVIDSMVYESLTQGGNEITEDTAKKEVIALARGGLKCEIEAFPSLDGEVLFFRVDDA